METIDGIMDHIDWLTIDEPNIIFKNDSSFLIIIKSEQGENHIFQFITCKTYSNVDIANANIYIAALFKLCKCKTDIPNIADINDNDEYTGECVKYNPYYIQISREDNIQISCHIRELSMEDSKNTKFIRKFIGHYLNFKDTIGHTNQIIRIYNY